MAYKIKLLMVRGDYDDPDTFFQKYDEDLTLISEYQYSETWFMFNSFGVDEEGNLYLFYNYLFNDGHLKKIPEDGGTAISRYSTAEGRGAALCYEGCVFALREVAAKHYVERTNARTLGLNLGNCSLTSGKQYAGLVFDDDHIFYTLNRTDKKIEKWNWMTKAKVAELALPTDFIDETLSFNPTLGLAGNNLMGVIYNQTTYNYWMTNKNLGGSVTGHVITGGYGSANCENIGCVEGSYFLMSFLADDKYYIRKYSSAGAVLATTYLFDRGSGGSVINEVYPSTKHTTNGKTEPTVVTLTPTNIVSSATPSVDFNGEVTDMGLGHGWRRGFQWYDVITPGTIRYDFEDAMWTPVREGYGLGTWTKNIDFYLENNHTYMVRAHWENCGYIAYGEWVRFSFGGDYPLAPVMFPAHFRKAISILKHESSSGCRGCLHMIYGEEESTACRVCLHMIYGEGRFGTGSDSAINALRQKCINFEESMSDVCLVVNHNTRVTREYLQNTYGDSTYPESSDFRFIVPSQQLVGLSGGGLTLEDCRITISNFIINVSDIFTCINQNNTIIKAWLHDYEPNEVGHEFTNVNIRPIILGEDLNKTLDKLFELMIDNVIILNANLEVLKERF